MPFSLVARIAEELEDSLRASYTGYYFIAFPVSVDESLNNQHDSLICP
jgi:hypothetical protein